MATVKVGVGVTEVTYSQFKRNNDNNKRYMYTIFLTIQSDSPKPIVARVQDNGVHSIMDLILKAIDDYKINTDDMSVIVTNILEALMEKSKVIFLDNAPFEDFLKVPINTLTELFSFNELNLDISIGGIGGEIGEEDDIHYFIHSGEHLPKHVHCRKESKECKCILDSMSIKPISNDRFRSYEITHIHDFVKKHMSEIIDTWNRLNPDLV